VAAERERGSDVVDVVDLESCNERGGQRLAAAPVRCVDVLGERLVQPAAVHVGRHGRGVSGFLGRSNPASDPKSGSAEVRSLAEC
jgi:hypothetical protein